MAYDFLNLNCVFLSLNYAGDAMDRKVEWAQHINGYT